MIRIKDKTLFFLLLVHETIDHRASSVQADATKCFDYLKKNKNLKLSCQILVLTVIFFSEFSRGGEEGGG